MRIYAYRQAPLHANDLVFRQPRIWHVLMLALCIGSVAVLAMFMNDPVVSRLDAYYLLSFLVLAGVVILWQLCRVCLPGNWLLRFDERRMLIKIGPLLETREGRVFVAELERAEVEWVRAYQRRSVEQGAEGKETHFLGCLEIKPQNVELVEFRACIARVAVPPRQWFGWTIASGVPASVTDDGIVRLEWRCRSTWVSPSLPQAVAILGSMFPVLPEVLLRDDIPTLRP